mgnify:CR=1 FL=1
MALTAEGSLSVPASSATNATTSSSTGTTDTTGTAGASRSTSTSAHWNPTIAHSHSKSSVLTDYASLHRDFNHLNMSTPAAAASAVPAASASNNNCEDSNKYYEDTDANSVSSYEDDGDSDDENLRSGGVGTVRKSKNNKRRSLSRNRSSSGAGAGASSSGDLSSAGGKNGRKGTSKNGPILSDTVDDTLLVLCTDNRQLYYIRFPCAREQSLWMDILKSKGLWEKTEKKVEKTEESHKPAVLAGAATGVLAEGGAQTDGDVSSSASSLLKSQKPDKGKEEGEDTETVAYARRAAGNSKDDGVVRAVESVSDGVAASTTDEAKDNSRRKSAVDRMMFGGKGEGGEEKSDTSESSGVEGGTNKKKKKKKGKGNEVSGESNLESFSARKSASAPVADDAAGAVRVKREAGRGGGATTTSGAAERTTVSSRAAAAAAAAAASKSSKMATGRGGGRGAVTRKAALPINNSSSNNSSSSTSTLLVVVELL